MNKFDLLESKVIPLALKDVDTDMIIPAQFLTSVSREGYGKNLFRRLRDSEPNFPFNCKEFAGAQILAADFNFGCGSSREHAVWSLMDAGIRVVIGKSFADIFSSNSAKNGLVLIVLAEDDVDQILVAAKSGNYTMRVDLAKQFVVLPDGKNLQFAYDPFRKHCILNGLDDIDYILTHKAEIEEFRKKQKDVRFFRSTEANN